MKLEKDSDLESDYDESPDGSSNAHSKRKRKLAGEMSHTELAKTRAVNRLAAQRYRQESKRRASEWAQKTDVLRKRSDELQAELAKLSVERNVLNRLVRELYGPSGTRWLPSELMQDPILGL